MKRVARCGTWVGALLLFAARARADLPVTAPREDRAALLRAGAEATKAKSWAACIDAYAAAVALVDEPEVQGRRGLCEEAAARNVDAYRHLFAALHAPGVDPTIEPYKRFGDAFARVATRVAQVYLAVDPPQAAIVVDGRPLGKAEGRLVVLDPGEHTFAARLAGYVDAIEPRKLEGGDTPSIHLVLTPNPKAPAPVSSTLARPALEPPAAWYAPAWTARGVLVTLTYASAATAIVSWSTTIGLELDRASMGRGLARDACAPIAAGGAGGYVDNVTRPPACALIHERAAQRDAAMDVAITASIGTALFGVLAGLAIRSDFARPRPSIALAATPRGGGIVISGAW